MRAVVYRGVNDLRLETVPVPRIGPGELLVKVAVCGVCPTDIKKIQHGTVPPPRIFGHETAGTIVSRWWRASRRNLGAACKIGDRVALHHHVPCLDCHFCRHHAFAQCETYKRTGITAGFEPAGGGYAEYVRVMPFVLPGIVKIPAKNSFAEGAMLEPVNTVLKAVRRLNLLPGDNVLVAGQGPIGLMFTRLLQLAGARVIATDLMESRLRLAKKFGAHWTFNAGPAPPVSRLISYCPNAGEPQDAIGSRSGLDAAVIAVPSDTVVQQAQTGARRRTTHALRPHQTLARAEAVPPFHLCLVRFAWTKKICSAATPPISPSSVEVARLVFSRQLDVRQLISHCFPLEQTADAIALAPNPPKIPSKSWFVRMTFEFPFSIPKEI